MSEECLRQCKLGWDEIGDGEHARFFSLYRRLIDIRRREFVPRLQGIGGNFGRHEVIYDLALKVSCTLSDGS